MWLIVMQSWNFTLIYFKYNIWLFVVCFFFFVPIYLKYQVITLCMLIFLSFFLMVIVFFFPSIYGFWCPSLLMYLTFCSVTFCPKFILNVVGFELRSIFVCIFSWNGYIFYYHKTMPTVWYFLSFVLLNHLLYTIYRKDSWYVLIWVTGHCE